MRRVARLKKQAHHSEPLGVGIWGGRAAMLLRTTEGKEKKLCFAHSKNNVHFFDAAKKVTITLENGKLENPAHCEHFRFATYDKGYHMTYVRKTSKGHELVSAISKDMHAWHVKGVISHKEKYAVLVSGHKHEKKYTLYYGDLFVKVAQSPDFSEWEAKKELLFTSRRHHFDAKEITLMGALSTHRGNVLLYDASYHDKGVRYLQIGTVLFSKDEPNKILWRSETPLIRELVEEGKHHVKPLGAVFLDDDILVYWHSPEHGILTASLHVLFLFDKKPKKITVKPGSLKRHIENPILSPHPDRDWENEGVFNPAALYDDEKVHLIYRALGKNGISTLGYASSKDGYTIDERLEEPAYFPRTHFEGAYVKGPSTYTELFQSGGGWGGCEDPKITAIDDKVYLTYVAFNGWAPPRVALSWIKKENFLKKVWKWAMPKLISRPNEINKSGCILPEKIDGKYVIFSRVFPDIQIDFVDSLNFKDGQYLKLQHKIPIRPHMWDSRKLSVGAPPIKTKDGWLMIYHAVDDRDPMKYKIGAMLLDLKDPRIVLHRTNKPLLEPDMHYENDWKPGIAYPCGAIVKDGTLFVYYGGGDKYVCVATAPLDAFLYELKQNLDIPMTILKSKLA